MNLLFGRAAGTKNGRVPIVASPEGYILTKPEGGEGAAPNRTFVAMSNPAGAVPIEVTSDPAAICCISLYNANTGGRWLFIWDGDAPQSGVGAPRWVEYLSPQDKTTIDLCGLEMPNGFSFALSASGTSLAVVGAGEIMAFNIGYRA